jgi:SAM-dependent methyltransferase
MADIDISLRDRSCCPLCGDEGARLLMSFHDTRLSNETLSDFGYSQETEFPIVECAGCKFMYSKRLLSDAGLNGRYEKLTDHRKSLETCFRPAIYLDMLKVWTEVFPRVAADAERISIKALDFGCGWGAYMKTVQYYGIECFGFDFDCTKAAFVRDQGMTMIAEPEAAAPFDMIICNQVLEHLKDPLETAARFRNLLKPGGFAWVSVPFNSHGLKADLEKGPPYRRVIDPWEHLNYFTKSSLTRVMASAGFGVSWERGPTEILFRLAA